MPKLLFSLLMLCSLAATAGAYRWVDANGKVHYGDQPPAGAQRLKAPPGPASGPKKADNAEAEQTTPDDNDTATTPFASGKQNATAAERCQEFKARQKRYQSAGRLLIDNPDGSQYELQPEEREKLLARNKAKADAACAQAGS